MDNLRVLHCGNIIDNYYKCVNEKLAGFARRFKENPNNTYIYFIIKVGKQSYCGARGLLGDLTDYKPWDDAERYVQCFRINNMEFCKPFNISFLGQFGRGWGSVFLVGSKLFQKEEAIKLMQYNFEKNKTNTLYLFEVNDNNEVYYNDETTDEVYIENPNNFPPDTNNETDENFTDDQLDIIGTFQTIKFKNEQDPIQGLEVLVTNHFYELFQAFKINRSVLIPQNRIFTTQGMRDENNQMILGIRAIPDALLISYDKDDNKSPMRINLIEYECYGESKISASQKFNYLNGHVIPQLMRFASTFSVVTDQSMRDKTISDWIEKIVTYVNSDDKLNEKTNDWIRELYPNIRTQSIDRNFEKELRKAFESNIKIILIIDELTSDQKETVKNIIRSFKLSGANMRERDNFIDFSSYVIRLEQKVEINNFEANFALSFQE